MPEVAQPEGSDAQGLPVQAMRCRACLTHVTPVRGTRTVMQHQSGALGQFGLFESILCCPKCGERGL